MSFKYVDPDAETVSRFCDDLKRELLSAIESDNEVELEGSNYILPHSGNPEQFDDKLRDLLIVTSATWTASARRREVKI